MKQLSQIIGSQFAERYSRLRDLIDKTIKWGHDIQLDKEEIAALVTRRKSLDQAAMFVVVGEVKAGKSSFINALFDETICEVDAAPCTATIQEIVYGENRDRQQLGTAWERITVPNEILKAITVVDTPGTNSVISNHQTITEGYLPQCDLVIFVLAATNPHTGTSWDFLRLIRNEWRHRVVFILQQVDRLTDEELTRNLQKVQDYAREANITAPNIFPVSARWEKDRSPRSGFGAFHAFLSEAVAKGEVWQIKSEGVCNVLSKTIVSGASRLNAASLQLAQDKKILEEIEQYAKERKIRADRLLELLLQNVLGIYDRLTGDLATRFKEGLHPGTVLRRSVPFIRDQSLKEWLEQLRRNFEESSATEIEREILRMSQDLDSDLKEMCQEIAKRIAAYRQKDSSAFQSDFLARDEIFRDFQNHIEVGKLSDLVAQSLPKDVNLEGNLQIGSGLAGIGAIIALLTKLAIFDVTGGILASAGLLLAAATLLFKRGAVIKQFNQEVALGKNTFADRLQRPMRATLDRFFAEIEEGIGNSRAKIAESEARLAPLLQGHQELEAEFEGIKDEKSGGEEESEKTS